MVFCRNGFITSEALLLNQSAITDALKRLRLIGDETACRSDDLVEVVSPAYQDEDKYQAEHAGGNLI
jgi:hypothetical protein